MKAQTGPSAVLHALLTMIASGFLMYFVIPLVDEYRIVLIQQQQLAGTLFTPLILLVLYILIPFIWLTWAFIGVFYITKTAKSNRGTL